jgi:hypothetical protein
MSCWAPTKRKASSTRIATPAAISNQTDLGTPRITRELTVASPLPRRS